MATISPNYSEDKKYPRDEEARDAGSDSDNDASIRALVEAGKRYANATMCPF
jgi:hypothetical protein